jgi:hypothetical protein
MSRLAGVPVFLHPVFMAEASHMFPFESSLFDAPQAVELEKDVPRPDASGVPPRAG